MLRRAALALFLVGCAHSDAFVNSDNSVGPSSGGADVLLTYNAEQDYWPAWTRDGKGILYAFVDQVPPGSVGHRCLGMLPPDGGSRIWSVCDARAAQADTVSSFTGYALDAGGQLLYAEAVAPARASSFPSSVTIWLADTVRPLTRRKALFALPNAGLGPSVNWLVELAWVDATTFTALGQLLLTTPHSHGGFLFDSLFADTVLTSPVTPSGVVLLGSISGGHATLHAIAGTEGATGYAVTSDGASIILTHRDDTQLYKVPIGGGAASVVAQVAPSGAQLVGVSCRTSTCIVGVDPLTLYYGGSPDGTRGAVYPSINAGARELRSVSLATGAVTVVLNGGLSGPVIVTPVISPTSSDIVAQVGGVWGHLQTASSAGSNLHLYHGLIP